MDLAETAAPGLRISTNFTVKQKGVQSGMGSQMSSSRGQGAIYWEMKLSPNTQY